jgi:filamentous hemagglutinin
MSKSGFATFLGRHTVVRDVVTYFMTGMFLLTSVVPSLAQSAPAPRAPLTPDPGAAAANKPGLDAARNGVPIVNIVKPNDRGVSHNKFQDFNVNEEGLILNNSPKDGPSALGGYIGGNPNLRGGPSASTIIGEVTGMNRSQMNGLVEIFGPAAGLIIANPNGITCAGCGFHNVQHGILSTGRPVFDENGAFTGLSVEVATFVLSHRAGASTRPRISALTPAEPIISTSSAVPLSSTASSRAARTCN